MAMSRMPKRPAGHVPFKDFSDTSNGAYTKVGLILRVDEINMIADVKIITGGGDRYEIDLTQAMAGPRSFWGGVPEVNSLVIIGYRRLHKNLQEAVILGYLPVGNRTGMRFDPFSVVDPADVLPDEATDVEQLFGGTVRHKRLMMRPGNVGGMSSEGSELLLDKNIRMYNRAGDGQEFRDADRTWVLQAVHKVETQSGLKRIAGPIRRSAMFLPDDIFQADGATLKTTADDYYGVDELQAAGPGLAGSSTRFANSAGKVLGLFNDTNEFPPVTYSNGRRAFYAATSPAANIEDVNSAADAFVEDRLEMSHTSDLTQEVIEEIDGFSIDRRLPYIERVLGTTVGNDLNSSGGQRQYARVVKPVLFPDFNSTRAGKFHLAEVNRQPTAPDIEALTQAGAFLFRMRPPKGIGENAFVAAVSKQGKLFLNVPASTVENYPSGSKRISAEVNMEGALKAFIGASAPDRVSAHITLEGGLHLDVGRDAQGNAITTRFHSATKVIYEGNPNEDDASHSIEVRGVKESAISGAERKVINGSKQTVVSGMMQTHADRYNVNAFSGASFNVGEWNQLVSGKSQMNYALAVLENIVAGGKVSTILAGGLAQNVLAGAISYTAAAGATTFNNPAGAFNVVVGTGALSLTTGAGAVTLSTGAGAMSLTAGAGAMSLTAGLALNLAASTAVSMVAPQILFGGPAAVLGVCRGTPSLPPGTPTLDPITGTPLFGSATVRSL